MKTSRLLRVLSLLGFLMLMAPFYDSCDMKLVEATEASADTTSVVVDSMKIDSIDIVKTEIDTIKNSVAEKETSFAQKIYDIVVDEESLSGFEIAYVNLNHTGKAIQKEIIRVWNEKKWYANLFVYVCFVFDFIVLISFSIFILSFTKKIKTLNKLALVNSILIIITLLYIIFLESSFEHFRQIKWGYYAFIITNLLIFYYSKLALKQFKSQIPNPNS